MTTIAHPHAESFGTQCDVPATIVIVAADFTDGVATGRANYELARHLAQRGARLHLVSHLVAEPLASLPNVVWHRVPQPFGRHVLGAPLLARAGRRVSSRLGADARVIVNGGNCAWRDVNWAHVVHAAWEPCDAHARLAFRLRNRWSKWTARRGERRAMRAAKLIIANSNAARRQIIEHLGIPPEKVRVVYLGLDASTFRPPDDLERARARAEFEFKPERPVVAFVGALGRDRNKGFDTLFEAWRRLCQDPAWDVDLVAAGQGAEVELWQRRVAQTHLSERVRLLGHVSTPKLFSAVDAMIAPSRYEAYGLAVHEALCCGVPAFVSTNAGVAERYPSSLHHLLLPNPNDTSDMIARLSHWRQNMREYRSALSSISEDLRRHSWADMAEEIRGLIEQSNVCQNRAPMNRLITSELSVACR